MTGRYGVDACAGDFTFIDQFAKSVIDYVICSPMLSTICVDFNIISTADIYQSLVHFKPGTLDSHLQDDAACEPADDYRYVCDVNKADLFWHNLLADHVISFFEECQQSMSEGVGVLGQECAVGKYGEDCQLNCSRSCAPYSGQDVHCDRRSGKCSEGCIAGWYGDQCQLSCSRNCQQHICSQQTGYCTLGCKGNNMGDFCETSRESGPKQDANEQLREPASTPLAAILVPVFVILIIIIITVAVLVIRHRRSYQASGGVEDIDLLHPGEVDTDLIVACKEGKLKAVKDILEQSLEDINKKGCDGMTPVMWAARRGHREVLDLLVRKEADLKLVDDSSNNILLLACLNGNVKNVKNILSIDAAGINVKGQSDWTPLMAAAHSGHGKVFDLLVNTGADLTELTHVGDDVLHVACLGGHVDIVSRVLELGKVDINSRGQCSRTPLMAAASLGHKQIFDLLVNKGANTTLGDSRNNNILHLACEGEHLDIVECILKGKMVDLNANNDHNQKAEMLTTNKDIKCKILLSRHEEFNHLGENIC